VIDRPLLSRGRSPGLTILWMLLIVWTAGGATCHRRSPVNALNRPPELFQEMPTVDQLAAAVNRTDRIERLQSNAATVKVLSMPSLPRLSANLALERPKRFRMRAQLPVVLGSGMDLGSNDEVFWMRVPEADMVQTLYFARHEEYARQLQRNLLPVDPTWLIDALGLVRLDPLSVVEGPLERGDGTLELRTEVPMPDGIYRRTIVVDATGGFVTEQNLRAPNGRLLASAVASDHRYYADVEAVLPHQVQLQLMPPGGEELGLRIEVGHYAINQLLSEDPRLFQMPADGVPRVINLMQSPVGPPGASEMAGASPGMASTVPPPRYPAPTGNLPAAGPENLGASSVYGRSLQGRPFEGHASERTGGQAGAAESIPESRPYVGYVEETPGRLPYR
jgi:hypothetical protein